MAARLAKALITGGDLVLVARSLSPMLREGADVAINYLPEEEKTPLRSLT